MASGRLLNLHLASDRAELSDLLTAQGIQLEPDAIAFASAKLNSDWLTAWASSVFNIRTSKTGTSAIHLWSWADTICSIYALRDVVGIEEQIRRLGVPSHEAIDTDLVIRVAGKYHRSGFNIAFEPNGLGCSDLLIEGHGFRSYAEIKRENQQDHKRYQSVMNASCALLSSLRPETRTWLQDRELRMEVKFSKTFSHSVVSSIIHELQAGVRKVVAGNEQALLAIPGSRYIVLPRQHPPFYEKGVHSGHIVVRQPGTPVQAVPQNMPILVVFEWLPNLKALNKRLHKAASQLRCDSAKDPNAQGFVVLEMSHGESAKDAIIKGFSLLPMNCLGVVLRSDSSYLIPRSDLSTEAARVLMLASPS